MSNKNDGMNFPKTFHPSQGHGILDEALVEKVLKSVVVKNESSAGDGGQEQVWQYGTAGFRYPAKVLDGVMVRVGLLAAARSSHCGVGKNHVGVMVTASHNPECDNGVKLADPDDGGMLRSDWEDHAVAMANASNPLPLLQSLLHNSSSSSKPVVHIGMDTRSHSPHLAQLTLQAAMAAGAIVYHHGYVTTPQLHYIVKHANAPLLPSLQPHRPFKPGYFNSIVHSYLSLLSTTVHTIQPPRTRTLTVDCACGIGGWEISHLYSKLKRHQPHYPNLPSSAMLQIQPINLPNDGPLNHECGAEHVQKQQLPFTHYKKTKNNNPTNMMIHTDYMCSVDGDADRIVFCYFRPQRNKNNSQFRLMDGDKIAVLVSKFIQQEIQYLLQQPPFHTFQINCGVVQTAYANGSSTHYLKNTVKTKVITAKTGVKYVHAAAHDNFDIGTYFEANGHGTVLFGPKFYDLMSKSESFFLHTHHNNDNNLSNETYQRANLAWRRLRLLPSLINQAVGDAISDMLLVDAILYLNGDWSLQTWDDNLYKDLPSKQLKVRVRDRSMITTNANETRALQPPRLQPALDDAMTQVSAGRTFVRPSGTENVVRIYAEAATQKEANHLANLATFHVHRLCHGIGSPPTLLSSNL